MSTSYTAAYGLAYAAARRLIPGEWKEHGETEDVRPPSSPLIISRAGDYRYSDMFRSATAENERGAACTPNAG